VVEGLLLQSDVPVCLLGVAVVPDQPAGKVSKPQRVKWNNQQLGGLRDVNPLVVAHALEELRDKTCSSQQSLLRWRANAQGSRGRPSGLLRLVPDWVAERALSQIHTAHDQPVLVVHSLGRAFLCLSICLSGPTIRRRHVETWDETVMLRELLLSGTLLCDEDEPARAARSGAGQPLASGDSRRSGLPFAVTHGHNVMPPTG